ncbi:MFS transporter [Wenjunlia tyrosinilytica]|uniref:MFS transporter n=1 Tax=Wenjunlia tyrosinilytica TaxID=1544741 RepID=A0A917ZNW1_9ACTN|nr:MFS transporter [Wenjunlia tyrosinilytica]GGO86310.1 MFS transporter [Wenjunlia tyrosinilytica]
MTQTNASAKAGRKEWIALGVLLLPCLLVSMDVSVLYFAVPAITKELEPSSTQQLWILDMYGFVLAGLLITMGALGDRTGRRKLLLAGAAAFGLASVAAAYAQSAEMLIACRALLGIGGATLMPSTLALIRNLFHDDKQRAKAVSIWSAAMVGGVSLGPILSGFLMEHFWWGSVFLVNTPAMLMLLLLAPVLLPEFKGASKGGFDFFSSLLSMGALLPVVYGLKEMAKNGFEALPALAVVLGLAVGLVFLRRQRTLDDPMIDLELFRRRAFGGSLLMNLIAMFSIVGFAIFTTQYLQSVLGKSPLQAALWSLVPSVAVGFAAPVGSLLVQRGVNRAHVLAGGFLTAALGFVELTRVRADSGLWVALTGAAVYAGGLVLVMTLGSELVMGVAPPERAGSASALLESSSELGGALGMAVLGSIGSAVYHHRMGGHMPAGVPTAAMGEVRETLGGAQAVAAHLPARTADTLLTTAREAFTSGMNAAAIGAVVVMAGAAVLAVALLRDAKAATSTAAGPDVKADRETDAGMDPEAERGSSSAAVEA